jgi:hypothetical protein
MTTSAVNILTDAELIKRIKERKYECFIEDHEPKPWTAGRCAGFAGRNCHLMRCKRKDGYGIGNLFCKQHAEMGSF